MATEASPLTSSKMNSIVDLLGTRILCSNKCGYNHAAAVFPHRCPFRGTGLRRKPS